MLFGIQDFPAFCLAVLVFLALPGPGTLALLSATGHGGFRAGALSTLGLMLGDQVLLWAAVAGVAALLAAYPGWFHALQWAGAGYLAWLGGRLLLQRKTDPAAEDKALPDRRFLRQAFTITVLNPKAIVFYLAFFPLFLPSHGPVEPRTYVAMAITIAVLTAAYCLGLCAVAGAVAEQVRRHRRVARALERLTGLFLIGFGLRLVRG
jgi:leucine efflux protein